MISTVIIIIIIIITVRLILIAMEIKMIITLIRIILLVMIIRMITIKIRLIMIVMITTNYSKDNNDDDNDYSSLRTNKQRQRNIIWLNTLFSKNIVTE